MVILNKPQYWFQTKSWRVALIVAGTVLVIALVVFNQQIGDLLNLFGSKAGISTQSIDLDQSNFLNPASTQTPTNSFVIDQGKFMLNDPANVIPQ